MPDLRFDERVVIITGAGGGLGRSHALELARRGARILVNDPGSAVDGSGSSTFAADRVVEEITALGGIAAPNRDSVATSDGGQAIVQAAQDEYGGRDAIEAAVREMAEPKRLWIVEGATHLFPGRLDPFEAAAREAVDYLKG